MSTTVQSFVLPVRSADPSAIFGDSEFTYVDISAVDRDRREIVTPQLLTPEVAPSRARQVLAAGDVIVSTVRPNLNTVALVPEILDGAIASTGFCVLRPNPERLDKRFLFHWISSESTVRRLVQQATGATYPAVSDKVIKSQPFSPPSLSEQQRIATILDKADSLRRKRQEAIRLADEFLRAVFYEKFGDPVTNSNGLPTSRIDRLCDVATGSTPARNRADYYDGPHPWIKTGEVDTPLITSAEEHISDAAIAETNCKLFPVGTLLIAMYGQGKTRGKVGMLGIPAATNQACAAILPSTKINRHFLYTQLSLMYEHLRAMGRGGNQENLNLGMIKSLEVLAPPDHLVDEFLKVRQKVSEMTTKALSAQAETDAMSQALAAKFFS